MDKIAISVLHTSITTVVLDTTTVVLGEDAAIVDQVDPELTVVVVAPVGDATMVDLDPMVGVTMGVL